MQVQLKQSEIIAAIKMYVANQGIDLIGKHVEVSFTAGRKETGLTADISIEGVELLALSPDEEAVAKGPTLTLVTSEVGHTEGATEKANEPNPFVAPAESAAPEVEAAAPAAAGKSLFAA